ncbi:serine-type D-Ala-D-Ala carboxypeptidase [Clostridioides difficile]|nr:serine-type D-Ala-D-Ala carboxypeptidase [Clostridioides difficile]
MKNALKKIISLAMILVFIIPNYSYADGKSVDKYSKTSILIDQETGRVLYSKEPDMKVPLASLSKMMTFLLAIEAIENKEVKETDKVKIDKSIASVKGSSYKLKDGEEVPLIELMRGLMIVSGNDAAIAIAKHICKTKEAFVDRMNKKAKEIGMSNTHFLNPNGLPIYDLSNPKKPAKENISTAKDIAILGKYMFDHYEKQVTAITDMETYTNSDRSFEKSNTNALLRIIPEVDGIKTGYTGNAGYCLSFSMVVNKNDKNEKKRRVIGVVLGTNHKNKRTSASLALLKYGKENFNMKKVIDKDSFIGKKYIKGMKELEVTLKAKDELYTILKDDESIKSEVKIKNIEYPVKKGDTMGVIKYYTSSGDLLGSVDIVSNNSIDNVSLKTKLKMKFAN